MSGAGLTAECPEIDWDNISEAGVKYGSAPRPRDTCLGSYREHDQDGIRTEYPGLYEIEHGEYVEDPEGRRFRVLGAGSVQGSVILENGAGDQFHADLAHWMRRAGR